MTIGHNHPPADEPSIEETVSRACRAIEVAALIVWAMHVLLTATW